MIWFQQLTAIHAGNHSKDAVKAQWAPFQGYDGFAVIRRAALR